MPEALVVLSAVGVRAGAVPVLYDVTLRLDAGEVLGVAGPNGAGKTTMLGVIATLVRPTSGTGEVLGARLGTAAVRPVRTRIGLAGHDPGLYPELTLVENLRLVARVAGLPDWAADTALAAVGLEAAAHRRADHSSHGMQRRVDLARLLALRPRLLLLDEAHAGLDRSATVIVEELVRRVRADGGGAVLVSHDPEVLAGQVDRMLHIDNGVVT